jgi:NTP pyrophosphatase (non-canonical NTP hydrolase)
MDLSKLGAEIEAISIRYAEKYDIDRDNNWFVLKLQEELGELIQSYLMMTGQARSKGKTVEEIRRDFEHEIADVFCHILLLAQFNGVDLAKAIDEKWLVWNKEPAGGQAAAP